MQSKPKQKQWFHITAQGVIPVIISYRVFTEDENAAFKALEQNQVQMDGQPKLDFRHFKKQKVSIKNLINGLTKFVKNF